MSEDTLNLLRSVVAVLNDAGIRFALGGAVALAAHGANRATSDVDLLTNDKLALRDSTWQGLEFRGVSIDIRKGDNEDPLRGVIRLIESGQRRVDIVVNRFQWQDAAIQRAQAVSLLGIDLPMLNASDLVLMKLFAGGPQDMWDIHQLLAIADRGLIEREVNERIHDLPTEAQELWQNTLKSR